MALPTFTVREGNLDLTFVEVLSADRFDDPHTHGRSDMAAVDFVVRLPSGTWLVEVKDPENPRIPPVSAPHERKEFLDVMTSGALCERLFRKLRDTILYLCLQNRPPTGQIRFIVILGFARIDHVLLSSLAARLRQACYIPGPFRREWDSGFDVLVFSVETWNRASHRHKVARV